jgi:hypothetical protein
MKSKTKILADYQNANFQERLHLFLDCRELRKEFTRIEQLEAVNQKDEKTKTGAMAKIKKMLLDLFPASLQSKLKHCRSLQ